MEQEFLKWIPFIIFIAIGAKFFSFIFEKYLKQTPVLGELLFGIVIAIFMKNILPGTLSQYEHPYIATILNDTKEKLPAFLGYLAPYGAIFLLFKAGIESHFEELRKFCMRSTLIALIGVAVPCVTCYFSLIQFFNFSHAAALLAGVTLTATSVAVTMRILDGHDKINSPEGAMILGAAVIDDIVGLIILGFIPLLLVVVGATNGTEGNFNYVNICWFIVKIFGFLFIVVLFGHKVVPAGLKIMKRLAPKDIRVIAIIMSCLFISMMAELFGLASIVGAFAVGLFLSDEELKKEVKESIEALYHILVPLFFVYAGTLFDVRAFNFASLTLMGVILAIAIVGKLTCALGAINSNADKLTIGVGMIPRGEVGLIFAQYGQQNGLIDSNVYGVLLGVIIITTIITPPILEFVIKKNKPA